MVEPPIFVRAHASRQPLFDFGKNGATLWAAASSNAPPLIAADANHFGHICSHAQTCLDLSEELSGCTSFVLVVEWQERKRLRADAIGGADVQALVESRDLMRRTVEAPAIAHGFEIVELSPEDPTAIGAGDWGVARNVFDDTVKWFCIQAGGRAVSVAGLRSYTEANVLVDVYTHPDFRGRGRATALCQHVLKHSSRVDGDVAVVLMVAPSSPAQRLYKRLGFRIHGSLAMAHVSRVDDRPTPHCDTPSRSAPQSAACRLSPSG